MSTENTKGRESDGTYFFCVKDKDGDLVHTTVAMDEEYSVEQFLAAEQTMLQLSNAGRMLKGTDPICCKSWEQFEAEGFSIATIRLVEFSL